MKVAVIVLAAVLLAASLLPMVRREAWWIRVFDFPRLQILGLGLIALGLAIVVSEPRTWVGAATLGAIAAAVLIQAVSIFPYTPMAPKQVLPATEADAPSSLSLLIANVLMSNRRSDRLLAMIADCQPDVVVLLEPDAWWEERMRVLEQRGYRHTLKEPLGNTYGMLLYSRLALLDPQVKHLLRDAVPSMHAQVRLDSGRVVWLHAVHPEPPAPTEAPSSLPRDAELLIVGREVKGRETPTIVAGDLNDVAWSHTTKLFQKTSGLLDPRRGRGMFNTFNARNPLLRWPLDHVFHSNHFVLADLRRLPAFGSDHFPVYVRLVVQPGADTAQQEPEPGHAEVEAARKKIEKAKGASTD